MVTSVAGTEMLALDAKSGSVIWSYGCSSNCGLTFPGTPPAVADGTAYVPCAGRNNFNGLCALNAANGALLWTDSGASGGNTAVSTVGKVAYVQNA